MNVDEALTAAEELGWEILRTLAAEVRRLRDRDVTAAAVVQIWDALRKYADRYPIILADALDALARAHQDEDGGRDR